MICVPVERLEVAGIKNRTCGQMEIYVIQTVEDEPHCHQEQKKEEEVLLYNRLINSRTAAVACGLCQWWTITIREYVISQWHLRFFKPTTSSSPKMTFGLISNISSSSVSQLVLEGIAFFAVTRLSLLNPKGTTGELTYKNPPSVQHVPIEDDRDRVCIYN